MVKILWLCEANVARSQMAQGITEQLAEERGLTIEVTSAGLVDHTHKFQHPTSEIIAIMKEICIDISHHVVKFLKREMLEGIDLIVVLCDPKHIYSHQYLIESKIPILYKEVSDPYEDHMERKRYRRDQVYRIVDELLTNFQEKGRIYINTLFIMRMGFIKKDWLCDNINQLSIGI